MDGDDDDTSAAEAGRGGSVDDNLQDWYLHDSDSESEADTGNGHGNKGHGTVKKGVYLDEGKRIEKLVRVMFKT